MHVNLMEDEEEISICWTFGNWEFLEILREFGVLLCVEGLPTFYI